MTLMLIVLAAAEQAAGTGGLPEAWIALLGAAFGGAGLKFVEHWLGRSKVKIDDATQIRDELREEIKSQREEIAKLEAEVAKWREEYYSLREKYLNSQIDLLNSVEKLRSEQDKSGPSDPLTGPEGE